MEEILNLFKRLFSKEIIPIDAKSAYYLHAYGKVTSEEELLKEQLLRIKETIQGRASEGFSTAMVEINEDLDKFISEIVSKYTHLGYDIIEIDHKKTVIDKKEVPLHFCDGTLLIFSWNNLKRINDLQTQN